MDSIRIRQAGFNASSRDQWDGFGEHRRRVSELLGAGRPREGSRLCILGAGNGNDLDLPALLEVHAEVHLVDIDRAALDHAAASQGVSRDPRLHRHPLDVTAAADRIGSWTPLADVTNADLAALRDWPAGRAALVLPGPFDRVASTCLLSQLIDSAYHALGDAHPRFPAVVRAIRTGHLRLLARLTRPGGTAVLVTDVVSSDTMPGLRDAQASNLADLLPRLARDANHIRGVHPQELLNALRSDPELLGRLAVLSAEAPWLWRLHARDYLVWAVTLGGRRA